jgi:hypothetical protein
MCDISRRQADITVALVGPLDKFTERTIGPEWFAYALLVLATDTPIDRAITYIKDTGSPGHARGRLLLRAAERSLRESGDTGEDNT